VFAGDGAVLASDRIHPGNEGRSIPESRRRAGREHDHWVLARASPPEVRDELR